MAALAADAPAGLLSPFQLALAGLSHFNKKVCCAMTCRLACRSGLLHRPLVNGRMHVLAQALYINMFAVDMWDNSWLKQTQYTST